MRLSHRLAVLPLAGAIALSTASCRDRAGHHPLYGSPIAGTSAAAGPSDYTFAFMGDTRGNCGVLAREIRGAVHQGCAFAVHGGDITRRGAEAGFEAFVNTVLDAAQGKLPMYPAIGNHDIHRSRLGKGERRNFRTFFGPCSYTFRYGPDVFVVIDNADEHFGRRDASSLEAELSSLRGTARHLFVIGHVPPVDPRPGGNHCLPSTDAARLTDVIGKYKPDLLLFSHIHGYAQTTVQGVPLVISGGAGARLEEGHQYHWVLVSVSGSRIRLQQMPLDE